FSPVGLTVDFEGRVRYLGRKDHKDQDVRRIELPNSTIYLRCSNEPPLSPQSLSIKYGGSVTRNEDEDFSGIRKCERMQSSVRQDIIRNVVDEDEEERQTA